MSSLEEWKVSHREFRRYSALLDLKRRLQEAINLLTKETHFYQEDLSRNCIQLTEDTVEEIGIAYHAVQEEIDNLTIFHMTGGKYISKKS